MKYYSNYSLKAHNTFGLDVRARKFVEVSGEKAFREVLEDHSLPLFILGGGSNLLLTKDLEALVVKNGIKGIEITEETDQDALVAIGGGENWHDCVTWSISKELGGLENLSLIPGTAGAAPIQNIGAYGVELEQVFQHLEAIDLQNGKKEVFHHKDCQFAYRNSVFKHKYKGQFFISRIYLRLSKFPQLNLSYGAVKATLQAKGIQHPTLADVSQAVIDIRRSKLPDPEQLGNSGSFFKNPEIEQEQFEQLQSRFPEIVFYPLNNGRIKIPAGWLIEQCGWKGKRVGNTGCYEKQALVLVNYGGATGEAVKNLAEAIVQSVREKFGITLEPEVNII